MGLKFYLLENLFDHCLQKNFWQWENLCLQKISLIEEKKFVENFLVYRKFPWSSTFFCGKFPWLKKTSGKLPCSSNFFSENFLDCRKFSWLWKISLTVEKFLDCGKNSLLKEIFIDCEKIPRLWKNYFLVKLVFWINFIASLLLIPLIIQQ